MFDLCSDFDLRNHLAPSCFEPGAMILPPQLEECLASIGVRLDDYEMQKLWERYSTQCALCHLSVSE